MRFELGSESDTVALAKSLAEALRGGEMIVLEGDLGAGKTFFARAVARALGVPDAVAVTSPTFALLHEYPEAVPKLLHGDLYRLGDPDELHYLGMHERQSEGWVTIVEWGERFVDVLGEPDLMIRFSYGDSDARAADCTGPLATSLYV